MNARMSTFSKLAVAGALSVGALLGAQATEIGQEVAIARHLQDGEEFQVSLAELLRHGRNLFTASWTIQEGGGRPLTKGTGAPLVDKSSPLLFPRNFNRLSAPDANSCAGCHNLPFGILGGGGDIVANVFVLGQRFDFITFDRQAFQALAKYDQDSVIEFLKSLQVLPPGTKHLVVDEHGKPKKWPPKG